MGKAIIYSVVLTMVSLMSAMSCMEGLIKLKPEPNETNNKTVININNRCDCESESESDCDCESNDKALIKSCGKITFENCNK